MGSFRRRRTNEIWSQARHPYRHSLEEFAYSNPALPSDITNLNSAMNYILAVLYPNAKAPVATPGDLPTGPNTPNPGDATPTIGDYRLVTDDGDGKSAGYRWEQREGDPAPQWYKIYDVDFSMDGILAAVTDVTQEMYVYQDGKQDLDENGDPITGVYAGQTIFGGSQANQNLTFNANSGDGVGAQTGFVQVDSQFRPVVDNTYDLSTATERWKDGYFAGSIILGTMTLTGGSITDSSGTISFGDENLSTTGNINGGVITGSSLVADDTVNTVTLVPGSYTDSSGAVAFGAANLTTTGTLGAGVTTLTDNTQTLIFDPDVSGQGSITSSTGNINFDDENLITTGTLNVGAITAPSLNVGNLQLSANQIISTNGNGNIELIPNGTGVVDVQKVLQTLDVNTTGTHTVTGILNVDNLRLDGNTLSSTDANGNVNIAPNGTGNVTFSNNLIPNVSGSQDFGSTSALYNDLFLTGGIRNATLEMPIGTLLSLRLSIFRDLAGTQPAQNGDALFWDDTNSVWLASAPDSEVDHTTISGLTTGDAGHTQFVMLAGRATGQTIQGGTAASENLTLESTSNATKGFVGTLDNLVPVNTAVFAGSWSGTDLGDSSHFYNDLYMRGEARNFRLENFTSGTLPAFSGQNIGRVMYATDTQKAYVDTGAAIKVLGVSKWVSDVVFDGVQLTEDVNVSAEIQDARNAQWQLLDNANNFETMYVEITKTSATNVRITTDIPLPAGSYRLIGVE